MSRKILLVEGPDDKHVVWAICQARGLPEGFEVEDKGGKRPLLDSLHGYLLNPLAYPTVGIMLDADEKLESTWDAVANRLRERGYSVPRLPEPDGLVIDHPAADSPRVGVWVMPDNQLPGELEDFVRRLIPKDDALKGEADGILSKIEEMGLRRYTDRTKAFIHTWLAWQNPPGAPFGQALKAKILDPASPAFASFVNWFRELFRLSS